LKDNLTIIIPTFNRSQLLQRALFYYSKWDCRILIADSSDLVDTSINNFKNCEYVYLRNYSFSNKIEFCLNLVETKFVCISCDDDFFSYNGMKFAIDFLQRKTDFIAVHGRYSQFRFENNVVYSYKQLPINDISIIDENFSSRLINSASLGFNPISMLYRRDVLVTALNACSDFSELIEYTLNIVPLLYGKRAMLPIFWMARDVGRYTDYSSLNYGNNIEERHNYKLLLRNKILNSQIGKKYFNNLLILLNSRHNNVVDNILLLEKIFFEIYFPIQIVEKSEPIFYILINKYIKKILPKFVLFYYRSIINNKSFSNEILENNDWEIIRNNILHHGSVNTL
jgi:glycosyltransferase domain-containing protein